MARVMGLGYPAQSSTRQFDSIFINDTADFHTPVVLKLTCVKVARP